MLILFVEDDERAIRHARERVQSEHDDVVCEVKHFKDAADWIRVNRPDIVSLDLVDAGLSGDAKLAGQEIYQLIWEHHFCPIIVYSAQLEVWDADRPQHPFCITVQKGVGSPAVFSKAVNDFRHHVDALRDAEAQVRREFTIAMRDLAPSVFAAVTDAEQRRRIIRRSGRRRLAAQMDDFSEYDVEGERTLAPWEHYLCPPVTTDLLLGDILRSSNGTAIDPKSFRVVLTPSCDLVAKPPRRPKVSSVLVAKCVAIGEGLSNVGMNLDRRDRNDETKVAEYKKKLRSELTQGFIRHVLPFPSFGTSIPQMAANFRNLELVPYDEIGDQGSFRRIASIDSPFRELVSWAYMQSACRPGMPDRNVKEWCDEICRW